MYNAFRTAFLFLYVMTSLPTANSNPYKLYNSAEHSLTFHSKVTICITNSTDTDDCITNPCVNGVCEDQVNGYLCVCDAGYNNTDCDNDIDVLMMWIVLTVPVLMDTGKYMR